MDKIAVVIPTYNRKNCLSRLLGQLKNQVLNHVEISIVVVIDGSTDGTAEMLKAEFPGIEIINGTGNWWWTKSVNKGCKLAVTRGAQAVLLMNDDTEIPGNYIAALLKGVEAHPGAVIGSLNITRNKPHRIYFSGVKKIVWWKARSVCYHQIFTPYDENLTGLHKSILLMGRGLFIPVPVFEKIGFFDEKSFPQYKADVDFVLRAHENHIETFISWDAVVYCHLGLTGKGATFGHQGFFSFLASFFGKNTYTNLIHSFRYYRKHCPFYLLPLSFVMDKFRLIYSFLGKRKAVGIPEEKPHP